MEYYIQTTDGRWEEVDKFVWDNYNRIYVGDDNRRYTDNKVAISESEVQLSTSVISKQELGAIARLCGITILPTGVNAATFQKPKEFLRVKTNKGRGAKSEIYYDLNTGQRFKRIAPKTPNPL